MTAYTGKTHANIQLGAGFSKVPSAGVKPFDLYSFHLLIDSMVIECSIIYWPFGQLLKLKMEKPHYNIKYPSSKGEVWDYYLPYTLLYSVITLEATFCSTY